ncbi:hypothetical protein QQS45_06330 [Alteriqipengyuania flavescens]|uniref:hypothetical protein n=1 Tax=Alteriqipengyuania flavescens TaxID=3053610 RepID=UPI0025B2C78D|nr:hypothetical protein [Alteriqipengyuania flavescens]WJY19826.1 hypothetical protein QQW98_06325 [Alteriqipengyuania flavescens]WJY25768.1 hypothetical protein QQS45_06330 [Alteriqipengyuania flavescens]
MSRYRIAYENAVASRDDLQRIYDASVASGSIPVPELDAVRFEAAFKDRKGEKSPKSGWLVVARELRLVELGCGSLAKNGMSHAQVQKEVQKALKRLGEAQELLHGLEYELYYVSAIYSRPDPYAVRHRERGLGELKQDLAHISAWLEWAKPPAKWNARSMRQQRVRLAVLLSPLFEREFGLAAKPVGGSASVEDADSNDWTRFYQMAASIFWGEHSTPDRQAVLWEATRPPMESP